MAIDHADREAERAYHDSWGIKTPVTILIDASFAFEYLNLRVGEFIQLLNCLAVRLQNQGRLY